MALNVGVIGCGNISGIYSEDSRHFPQFNIIACADLDKEKAEEAARKYGIESVYSAEEMIASSDIDMSALHNEEQLRVSAVTKTNKCSIIR